MMRIPGLESIGWALLNSFWQFGLLSFLYLLFTRGDTRFTAAIRHNIALTFSLAGSLWFLSDLFVGGRSVALLRDMAPATVTTLPGNSFTLESFLSVINGAVALLPWIYISVLLLRTGYVLMGNGKKRMPGQEITLPVTGSEWIYFLDKCRRELGIRRAVLLRWTGGAGMARTYGFFRPVVLFPVALLSRLSIAQVEAILVHELAHIRRNDYLTHLWMSLFRFVFYFNPFACFLYDTVSCEREKACDDLVLGRSYPAVVYADALMTLEQFRQTQLKMSLAASGHRPLQLADRIRRIAGLPVTSAPRRPMYRLLIMVFLVAVVFYGFRPVMEMRDREKSTIKSTPGSAVVKIKFDMIIAEPAPPALPPPVLPPLKLTLTRHPEMSILFAPAPAAQVKGKAIERSMDEPADGSGSERKSEPVVSESNNETSGQTEDVSDTASPDRIDPFPVPDNAPEFVDEDISTDKPAFAAKKLTRSFSYRNSATGPGPVSAGLQPYVPSSSFEYLVTDSVPVIALQSLQQNKTAVVQLLAKWKSLQLQQNISRSLEARYLQLKTRAQRDLQTLPAKKESLRKSLENLKDQMRIRKAEMDRLSTILAEEPVIYI